MPQNKCGITSTALVCINISSVTSHNIQQEIKPISKTNKIQHSLLNTKLVHLCYNLQKCFPLWQRLFSKFWGQKKLCTIILNSTCILITWMSCMFLILSFLSIVLSWVLQNGLLRTIHQWLGFSSIIWSSVLSSHLQPTVFGVTVGSLWKTGQANRTQYCFNSSGFGESFIGSFTPERKRRPSWRTNRTEQDRRTRIRLLLVLSRWQASAMLAMCTCCCSASCDWWTFKPGWIWLVGEDGVLRGGHGRAGCIQRTGLDWAGEATPRWEEHVGRGGGRDWLMVMWSQNTVALEPNRGEKNREKIRRGR